MSHWLSDRLAYKSTILQKEEVLGFSFESQLAHNFETVCHHNTERARTSVNLSHEWNTESIWIWNVDVNKNYYEFLDFEDIEDLFFFKYKAIRIDDFFQWLIGEVAAFPTGIFKNY